jgi:hypothetical protein
LSIWHVPYRVPGYSTLMTAMATMFYLWIETKNVVRPTGIIEQPEELLFAS